MLVTSLQRWDIFCNVIDNFGDIGVCWRLARQLAATGYAVRLWVDDLGAFHTLCPQIDPARDAQACCEVAVHRWTTPFAEVDPGEVVVEAFACRLPESFESAMAARRTKPVWINLDYLSAEAWTADYHALPSPHPRLPLTKYFFFPGFDAQSGGLLREPELEARQHAFLASTDRQAAFLASLGVRPVDHETLRVSLFSYENPALPSLLAAWADGRQAVQCLAAASRNLPGIESFADRRLRPGDVVCRGRLELHVLPFLPQDDYDALLWLCDLNCVRGEDSFVRAQWAARPMLWHIYLQEDGAHRAKLDAFLDRYGADLPDGSATASAIRNLHLAWNGDAPRTGAAWDAWVDAFEAIRKHAAEWQKKLIKQQDLCSRLVQFCQSKL